MKLLGTLLLWVIALCALALSSWGVTLYMEWPVWIAVAMFFGFIALYFLTRFVIRMVRVLRSRSRLAQQSAETRSAISKQLTPEALLVRKWKAAVATLRNSSLKRLGNPLYVLPWYMVIGKSGTGKTTALTRARLASQLQKVDQNAPIEQTLNYDWWYFDQAVVIDCAGRYVGVEDIEQDRREWEKGLDLLARYRAREGVNGLVLAISAERLLNPDRDGLIEEGKVIRNRIEQLIRLFDKRFPIYVLVTQCDRLYGLEEWARQLPEETLQQAMGFLKGVETDGVDEIRFLEQAFHSIGERLRALRVDLMSRNAGATPPLLLFPNELEQLKPGLQLFLKACFADNPYFETPFLRGLFFSSAEQEGGAVSKTMGELLPPVPRHANTHDGLFLRHFFSRILPQDRDIALPAMLVNSWKRVTQNLGVAAWVLLCAAALILMSVAFVGNQQTLALLEEQKSHGEAYGDDFAKNVAALSALNDSLIELERRNAEWQTGWMARTSDLDTLEARLKEDFVSRYRQHVLPFLLRERQRDLDAAMHDGSGPALAAELRNLVRAINLQQAHLNGVGRAGLQEMPQPEHLQRHTPELFRTLQTLSLSHLAWTPVGDRYLNDMLAREKQLLTGTMDGDPQLKWLAGLPATTSTVREVASADFWGDGSTNGNVKVAPAFTTAGKALIDAFFAELEKSVDDAKAFGQYRSTFEDWYAEQRTQAWKDFLDNFPDAEHALSGETEWRARLGQIVTQSPYYRVLDRLNQEFSAVPEQQLPSWLQLAREFQRLRSQARVAGQAALKIVGAINSVGGKAVKETLSQGPQHGGQIIQGNLEMLDVLVAYQDKLQQAATDVMAGTGKAYQLVSDFHLYGIDPAVKESAFHTASDRLTRLRKLSGINGPADASVWKLIGGPLHFVLTYAEQQASCELQKEWQTKVIWPLQTAPDKAAMIDQLYGAKGSVWAFADGMAKPFLGRDDKRFRIVQTNGYSVPFTPAFLPALNGAVDQRVMQLLAQQRQEAAKVNEQLQAQKEQLQAQQAQVQLKQEQAQLDRTLAETKQKAETVKAQQIPLAIAALPTSVNPEATAKPFATELTIQCSAGTHALNNYNFPVSESMTWAVGQCGDVNLRIKIDKLVLSKKYPGPRGLVNFLQDFRGGARQFSAEEFPASKIKLQALGVQYVGLRYNFDGQDAILKQAQQLDALDKQEKEQLQEKQKLQDAEYALEQQNLQAKLNQQVQQAPSVPPVLPAPSMHVLQPVQHMPHEIGIVQQIGACWNQPSMPPAQTQTTDSLIRDRLRAAADSAEDSAARVADSSRH